MISKTFLLCIMILGLAGGGLNAAVVNGTANLVLGQPDFTASSASAAGLDQPRCVIVDPVNRRVFVADYYNNRVLWWNNAAGLTNGKAPDGVLGQANFSDNEINRDGDAAANTLFHPSGLAVDGAGNLWVADFGNHRVLRYSGPLSNGRDADLVLGQASMSAAASRSPAANTLNHPIELCFDDAGNLWISDFQNHRVLRFRPPFATNQSADLVLGQKNFSLGELNDSDGDGVTDTATAATFHYPDGIFVDQAGSVWVADHQNQRVLRFSGPLSNGRAADLVLGAVNFSPHTEAPPTAGLIRCAYGVWGDRHGSYWVTDTTNSRILRFSGTLSNGMNASQVLGQAGFTSGWVNRGTRVPGADSLNYPCFVTVDPEGNLWVADQGNNRVLKYNAMKVLSLDVTRALNTGPREIVITGEGMVAGTTIKLARSGQPDIVGTNVVVAGEDQIRCTLDLTGAAGGMWDVVIQNNGLSATLPAALEVVPVKLASMAPTSGFTTGPVHATLTGENFFDGIVPALKQGGQPDVTGQFVNLISSAQLTCQFDLSDAATGFWNVTVPPANRDATLANGFQVFYPSVTVRAISRNRSYRLGIDTPRGVVIVDVPAGAFAEDCVLTIAEPAEMPDIDPDEFTPTDVAVEIVNDKQLPLLKIMTISFFYNSHAVAGLDRARLVVTVHERGIPKWLQANSIAYANSNKVVARVRSLSIFRVVQRVVKPDLSTVAVYPNPYRPGSGAFHDDTMMGRGVVFSGLTNRATIKVFTLTGEQVIEINEASGTGVHLWNTENDKNEKVASGVYIYLITNPDDSSQKRKGKFAIIR